MPKSIETLKERTYENIEVSPHAIEQLESRGIDFFDKVSFSGKNIIEVEINNGFIKYVLLEFPFDKRYNLFVALSFQKIITMTHDEKVLVIVKTVFKRDKTNMLTINGKEKANYYKPYFM